MVLNFGSNTVFPNKIMWDSTCMCFFNLSMSRKDETAMTKMKQVVHSCSNEIQEHLTIYMAVSTLQLPGTGKKKKITKQNIHSRTLAA